MACRVIVDIIKNYCETNNISLELISSNWILKLTNIIRYIHGYQFDLNSAGTLMIGAERIYQDAVKNMFEG